MTLWSDVRFAGRLLLKDRAFATAAVVVLALGIAATSTVFTMVNGVLLRDLPFEDADRVVQLGNVSYLDAQDWRASATTFDAIGAAAERGMSLSDDAQDANRYRGAYITANAFSLLRQRPVQGRDFREDDERPGATPVVMLGHDVWRTRYESQPGIVGRTIRVNGVPSVVVGVMPQGFEFPLNAKLWQPVTMFPAADRDNRAVHALTGFGRLRAGVTHDQASAELRRIADDLERTYPTERRDRQPRAEPFRSGIGGPVEEMMAAMMGAVLFVLLIACANVANLLLARGATRAREISVRVSLGASRWRIVRQLLVESLLLAIAAGVVALALSSLAVRTFWNVVSQVPDPPPFWLRLPIDAQVLAFLAAVCVGTPVVFGLLPALRTSKTNLVEVMNEGTRTSTLHRGPGRTTGALVAGQLALALMLLAGAGIMMRNLLTLVRTDAGVDTSGLVRMGLDLPAAYASPEQRLLFYRQLDERLASLTGVRAAFASVIPAGGGAGTWMLHEGQPESPPGERPIVSVVTAGPRYFETLRAPLLRGRAFAADDGLPGKAVAIVNQRLVDAYFGGRDAIGSRIRLGTRPDDVEWLTVIGVASNVRQQTTSSGAYDPVAYVPLASAPPPRTLILARAELGVAQMVPLLREQVRALDGDVPIYDVRTVDEHLAMSRWGQRVFGSVFVIFAGVALVLAVIGLYAVTAYAVSQRRREFGVRIALGAQGRQILWLVARRASRQVGAGLLIGGAGAFAVSRVVPAMLGGARGNDPLTLLVVTGLLIAAAACACLVPVRRAIRLDPTTALRAD